MTWYITDHLGSVRALVDTAGNVIAQVDYDSFGNILATTGNATSLDRYLYTGREFDPIINQYHYRTRQYDPRAGVFTTEDTIGFWGGDTNLNRYAGNVPNAYTDAFGTMAETAMTYQYEQRVTMTLLGQTMGAAFGFVCGFVEGMYANRNKPNAYYLALQQAVQEAGYGSIIGAGMGYTAGSGVAGIYFTAILSAIGASFSVIMAPNSEVRAIRGTCVVVGLVIGRIQLQNANRGSGAKVPSSAELPQSQVRINKFNGDATADAIAIREHGTREHTMSTLGGKRIIDIWVLCEYVLAIESKVGRTSLDSRVRQELARDWWLLRKGEVDKVRWEFSPNDKGELGPTKPLLEVLNKLGFEVQINLQNPRYY